MRSCYDSSSNNGNSAIFIYLNTNMRCYQLGTIFSVNLTFCSVYFCFFQQHLL